MSAVDPQIVAKAKAHGVLPEKLRDAAWIRADKLGRGRYINHYTDLFVLTYQFEFLQIKLPRPAKSLLHLCTILEQEFFLKVLAIEESPASVIYIDRAETVVRFGLDPSDHFAFDRIAAWMKEHAVMARQ